MGFVNEENQVVGEFLLNKIEGQKIYARSKNYKDLEKAVREYHLKIGIPNWEFEDDADEGINWVTFNDLFNTMENLK
tara:strand:- start:4974 stop:5204 length:231 start_codon:yes stop_codon:yes gene_type:complete